MMLHDDGLDITSEKLAQLVKNSGNEIEPYWPMLFAKALKGQDVGKILSGAIDTTCEYQEVEVFEEYTAAAAAEECPREEEPEDVDMGALFGGDDDDYGCEDVYHDRHEVNNGSEFLDAMVSGAVK